MNRLLNCVAGMPRKCERRLFHCGKASQKVALRFSSRCIHSVWNVGVSVSLVKDHAMVTGNSCSTFDKYQSLTRCLGKGFLR